MKKPTIQKELVLFKGPKGQVKLKGDFRNETLWASQAEMAQVFGVTSQNITLHLKNIYKEAELTIGATCKENLQVQKEGNREVVRKVQVYNLDAIIAVGYRVSSIKGTQFRQWATKTLRTHITQGFTINPAQIANKREEFLEAVAHVRALLPKDGSIGGESVLDLVQLFADTWFSLDAYDKEQFTKPKVTKKKVKLTASDFLASVTVFKEELMRKGEATENFATERNKESVEGIIGNVLQSFAGVPLYPTLEEKAVHLLYFIIKNHPFVDGNKRTGAYAFVWFLKKAGLLNTATLTPAALTALTLLVAESDPNEKERITKLIVMLLGNTKRK
jgi:prophage maintenance system killer protein